jgi:hypothetical protein
MFLSAGYQVIVLKLSALMTELPVLALNIAFRLLAKKTKTKNSQQKFYFKVAFKIWLL